METRDTYDSLHRALAALQDVLRNEGLQHLAAKVPVMVVRTDDDFTRVQAKLQTVKTLLGLRPPPKSIRRRIHASVERVATLVSVIDDARF